MPFIGIKPAELIDDNVDLNGGTIDGITIGGSTAAAGTFTNLTATGTLTLPDDGISGDDVNGGTISNFASTGIDDNASSTSLTINSSNNVGIGGSPSARLHVKDNEYVKVIVQDVAGTDTPFSIGSGTNAFTISNNTLANTSDEAITLNANNQSAIFVTAGAERMRIDGSGNVGINTVSASGPQSTFHIEQNGDDADGGFRLSRDNALASYTQYINTSSIWNLGYGNPSSDDSVTDLLSVTTSGNVGIGTTSPANPLDVTGTSRITGEATFGNDVLLTNAAYVYSNAGGSGIRAGWFLDGTNQLIKGMTGGSERMRVSSDGQTLIGKTSLDNTNSGFRFVPGESAYASFVNTSDTGGHRNIICNRQSSNGTVIQFDRSNSTVGEITISSSSTTYGTSSDERLKQNIVDAPAGNIDAVRVRSFDWKVDGSHQRYGMIAQELVSVAPEAVIQGETEDHMWGVDYSKLVPMMIKEIQDLKAKVAALEAK